MKIPPLPCKYLALGFAACVLGLATPAIMAATPEKPNVIFIMTDDQGSVDMGCYGATDLQTPAMDALAARSVRFTQFYSAAPVCSPSRAGFLTGRYPWTVGMPNNGDAPPSEKDDQANTYAGGGISTDVPNVASVFRAAGYATAHIGKWHLGIKNGHRPLDLGFDYSFGFLGGCIDNYSHFDYWDGPNREDLWENNQRVRMPGHFFPDLMVDKATAFFQNHRDKPFFMYFAVNMPHYPYQGDPKWLEYYKDKKVPYPRDLYAAFVSTLDDRIGLLLKNLDAAGLRENTIVVLQADNGYSREERAHGGGGNAGPYRGSKFSVFEGGIRLPAMISWPGHLPQGEVRGQVVHGCDWLPTLAELCGVKFDAAGLNGVSEVPVIRSADAPGVHADPLQWRFGKQWAVREGPWKLMRDPMDPEKKPPVLVDGHWFLANIDRDPGEQTNEAADQPDIVAHLKTLAPPEAEAAASKAN